MKSLSEAAAQNNREKKGENSGNLHLQKEKKKWAS